jgi:hypothetical protein
MNAGSAQDDAHANYSPGPIARPRQKRDLPCPAIGPFDHQGRCLTTLTALNCTRSVYERLGSDGNRNENADGRLA